MRFQRLDLNLLVALDALLTEKSVSIAADRICLSQSATSSALGRLREYFGDELLVVKGRNMVLTARAEGLVEPVRAVLAQIRSTIAIAPAFDPATSDRTIRIMASDYVTDVLIAGTLNVVMEDAPHMRFEVEPMHSDPVENLERGNIDLLVTLDFNISADHPSQILFEDDYVVIGCANNPKMAQPMTRDLYFELSHVTTRFSSGKVSAFDDWFVRRQKQERKVAVVAPTSIAMASFVIGSDRIATMHRRLANRLAQHMPIAVREIPLDIPLIREAIQWHISNNNDPAIRWMVERLTALASVADADMTTNIVALDLDRAEIREQFQTHVKAPGRDR